MYILFTWTWIQAPSGLARGNYDYISNGDGAAIAREKTFLCVEFSLFPCSCIYVVINVYTITVYKLLQIERMN